MSPTEPAAMKLASERLTHEIEFHPPFHDFDPLAIVWHGHYVKYFELARTALLRAAGYDFRDMAESGYSWPVVDMRLKFVRPAKLGQAVKVRATVVEWESRFKVDYRISHAATGEKLTEGYTIQVAVDLKSGEMQYVCPRALWECLGVEV
jgi:acyl-CoA thioester hydrolase